MLKWIKELLLYVISEYFGIKFYMFKAKGHLFKNRKMTFNRTHFTLKY